jgi:benzoyl-CoA 2,3-dioxygenase component B
MTSGPRSAEGTRTAFLELQRHCTAAIIAPRRALRLRMLLKLRLFWPATPVTADVPARRIRLAAYTTETITPKYHEALIGWQKKNFPELTFLQDNWKKYYPTQTPYQLFAKIGKLQSETIGYGRMAGQSRVERAGDMVGNMFYTARDIIRAQASTELGSIQQHRLTLEEAPTDVMKVAILRIMAEELRHGYQMFWVFDADHSWKKPGHPDVATDTLDELLSMQLGNHVLDAFNIPFYNFLDNVIFATLIDLVGKYQLEMQKVFSYAPMARSMGPMLSEEGYHIGSGRGFLKELSVSATNGNGRYSIDEIQRAINVWLPRGVEMFGNERGGETAIAFGFKDRTNGTVQSEYYNEVRELIELTNVAIAQTLLRDISAPDARSLVREVQDTHEEQRGIAPQHLLMVPDVKFYRQRGMEEIAFMPYDVDGILLTENGKPLSGERYIEYLKGVLPSYYVKDSEFAKYSAALLGRQPKVGSSYGW